MTNQEALNLIRDMLKAKDEEELMKIVTVSLPHIDGTFFAVLNQSVEQLHKEGKGHIADALERLGDKILSMRTLI